jgi:hypothetical protein
VLAAGTYVQWFFPNILTKGNEPSPDKNRSFKDTTDYEARQKIFLMLLSRFLTAFNQANCDFLSGGKTTGIKANDTTFCSYQPQTPLPTSPYCPRWAINSLTTAR